MITGLKHHLTFLEEKFKNIKYDYSKKLEENFKNYNLIIFIFRGDFFHCLTLNKPCVVLSPLDRNIC